MDLAETMPRRREAVDRLDVEVTIDPAIPRGWGDPYRAKLVHPSGNVTFLIAKDEVGFGKDSHKKNPLSSHKRLILGKPIL
jgi:hypothetical protein